MITRVFIQHADGSRTELFGHEVAAVGPGGLATFQLATPYRVQPGDTLLVETPLGRFGPHTIHSITGAHV